MEREYLVEGIIVIVVLMVLFVGFLSLFPEARDKIKDFSADFLGLGFTKSVEDVKESVKLMRDSIIMCSASAGSGCTCTVDLDVAPKGYKVIVDNSGTESKLILVNEHEQVEASWELGGKKVGLPVALYDGGSWDEYCRLDSFFLEYDSGWKYKSAVSKIGLPLFSPDKVSQYQVIKLGADKFCFVSEAMLEFEKGKNEKASTIEALVKLGVIPPVNELAKIGPIPLVEGTLFDSYSGKEFYSRLGKCSVLQAK